MNVYSVYFSPTGGTKKIMDILAGEWKHKVELDLSLPDKNYGMYRFQRGDVCLIGVPSFGGRVPEVALKRLKQIKADHAAAILVVSYGNRAYEDTVLELRKTVESCGFCVVAAVTAVAEHSIMHKYGAGRPDVRDEKRLRAYAARIKKKLLVPKAWKDFFVPGRYPYKEFGGIPLKPETTKDCRGCGICAAKCPVKAIPKKKPSQTDGRKCITCMRCVSVCPHHSRRLKPAAVFAVTLKMRKACSGRKEPELFM